jgi:hypothetical protein
VTTALETSSDVVIAGKCFAGETVEALETRTTADGRVRIRISTGWLSVVASNGKILLEDDTTGVLRTRIAEMEVVLRQKDRDAEQHRLLLAQSEAETARFNRELQAAKSTDVIESAGAHQELIDLRCAFDDTRAREEATAQELVELRAENEQLLVERADLLEQRNEVHLLAQTQALSQQLLERSNQLSAAQRTQPDMTNMQLMDVTKGQELTDTKQQLLEERTFRRHIEKRLKKEVEVRARTERELTEARADITTKSEELIRVKAVKDHQAEQLQQHWSGGQGMVIPQSSVVDALGFRAASPLPPAAPPAAAVLPPEAVPPPHLTAIHTPASVPAPVFPFHDVTCAGKHLQIRVGLEGLECFENGTQISAVEFQRLKSWDKTTDDQGTVTGFVLHLKDKTQVQYETTNGTEIAKEMKKSALLYVKKVKKEKKAAKRRGSTASSVGSTASFAPSIAPSIAPAVPADPAEKGPITKQQGKALMAAYAGALKQSAAVDSRFKSALKKDSTGDPELLRQTLSALVVAGHLIEQLLLADVQDNIKGKLRSKLNANQQRIDELQPMAAALSVKVPTVAEAEAEAAKSITPSAPAVAPTPEEQPAVSQSQGTPLAGQTLRNQAIVQSESWEDTATKVLSGVQNAERNLNQNTDERREAALLADMTKQAKHAEHALDTLLTELGDDAAAQAEIDRKLSTLRQQMRNAAERPPGGGIRYTSSETEEDASPERAAASNPAPEPEPEPELEPQPEPEQQPEPEPELKPRTQPVPQPVPQPQPATHYRSIAEGVIREDADMDSKTVGRLEKGEVIIVTNKVTLDGGGVRLQFDKGWASMTAKSGKILLKPLKDSLTPSSVSSDAKAAAIIPDAKTEGATKSNETSASKADPASESNPPVDDGAALFDAKIEKGITAAKGNCKIKIGEHDVQVLSADQAKVLNKWMFTSLDSWEGNKDKLTFKTKKKGSKPAEVVLQMKGGKVAAEKVVHLLDGTAGALKSEIEAKQKVEKQAEAAALIANMPKSGRALERVVPGMPVRSPTKKDDSGNEMRGKIVQCKGQRVQVDFATPGEGSKKSWLQMSELVSDADPKDDDGKEGGERKATGSGVHYKTLVASVIRKTEAMDSERTGELGPGEVIVAIETKPVGSTTRVKFDRGWTSVTAKNGTQLLQEVPAGTKPGSGSSKADKKDKKDKMDDKKKKETKQKPELSAAEAAELAESQNTFDCEGIKPKTIKGHCKLKIGQINLQIMSKDMRPLASQMYQSLSNWESDSKNRLTFHVKETVGSKKKDNTMVLQMKDAKATAQVLKLIDDNLQLLKTEMKVKKKAEKEAKESQAAKVSQATAAKSDSADASAATASASVEKEETSSSHTSAPDHEKDVAKFLSEFEKGSPERVQLSVPRVCTALGTIEPNSSKWIAELKALGEEGMLDDFLQACKEDPAPEAEPEPSPAPTVETASGKEEQKQQQPVAAVAEAADTDEDSDASTTPAVTPQPEPVQEEEVLEMGGDAVGNPMNDDSDSDGPGGE